MKKPYQFLVALGIAAASLSSCSRANYAVNSTTPTSQPVQVVAPASDAAASGTALVKVAASEATPAKAAPAHEATVAVVPRPAATPAAKVAKEVAHAQPAALAAPEAVATNVAPGSTAKPSLVQRLVVQRIAKQLDKMQKKQAAAGTNQTAASKKGRAALIALAGLILALIGIAIVGGSLSGGTGAGFAIGVVLYYIGLIAFLVGIILLVIHLVSGD